MDIRNIAYLRYLQASNQCDLTFQLEFEHIIYGTINEEFHAVRQITDTVQSLMTHIKNKILRLIQNRYSSGNEVKDEDITVAINTSITQNNEDVDGETVCKDLLKKEDLVFTIFDKHFRVIVNAPLVKLISLPQILYANFSIQPLKCKTIYTDSKVSQYFWYKSLNKVKWYKVGDTYRYKSSFKDIDHYLKFQCIPRKNNLEGPIFEIISKGTIQKMPPLPKYCPYQKRHLVTKKKLDGRSVRVVTYNTLSDRYSASDRFPYCPEQYLAIDYRKQLILKEILGYNADIVCLQEVDNNIFRFYLNVRLKEAGYLSIFHKKGNKMSEGLLCIINTSRFELIDKNHIVLGEEILSNKLFTTILKQIKVNKAVEDVVLKQATSLQVIILKNKKSNDIIIVANTHLFYRSDANSVRLFQVAIAFKYLGNLLQNQQKLSKNVSIIFCGDFNSKPVSGVYEFFTAGNIKKDHCDWKFAEENEVAGQTFIGFDQSHHFAFQSACGTPEFTNYTEDFKGCLDYIFYQKKRMSVISSVPLPSHEVLSENVALPNAFFPSDHIALIADLQCL